MLFFLASAPESPSRGIHAKLLNGNKWSRSMCAGAFRYFNQIHFFYSCVVQRLWLHVLQRLPIFPDKLCKRGFPKSTTFLPAGWSKTKHKNRRQWGQDQTWRGNLPSLIQTGESFLLKLEFGLDLFWLGGSLDICKTKKRQSNTSHL